jgi:hypothetical protein
MTSHILGEPRTELASGGLPHLGARPGESASWGTWAIICVTALIPFGQLQEATLGFSPPKVIVPAVLFALLAVRGGRITVSWLGIMAIFMAAWVAASGLAKLGPVDTRSFPWVRGEDAHYAS